MIPVVVGHRGNWKIDVATWVVVVEEFAVSLRLVVALLVVAVEHLPADPQAWQRLEHQRFPWWIEFLWLRPTAASVYVEAG